MNKQNKSKIKTLTEMKSFSLLFSLKANSCMFWTRPQVYPKVSCIHKMWLPWLIMGSGELQQEVILWKSGGIRVTSLCKWCDFKTVDSSLFWYWHSIKKLNEFLRTGQYVPCHVKSEECSFRYWKFLPDDTVCIKSSNPYVGTLLCCSALCRDG